MDWSDVAKGCAVFLCVIIAGWSSTGYVDRQFAAPAVSQHATPSSPPTSSPSPAPTQAEEQTPDAASNGAACVDSGGSWKNWKWPNVPMLSPKCPTDQK